MCHFVIGDFAEAVRLESRAVRLRPHFGTAWRTLAASAGISGDQAIAVWALSEAKRLQPSLSLDWVVKYYPMVRPEHRALYIEGLRMAGLS
jgi:adenylate cyclase